MKGNDFIYATKVWRMGVLVGPMLHIMWQELERLDVPAHGVTGGDWSEYVLIFILMVLCGAFFSIPSWLVLWLATAGVNRLSWSETARKILLVGIVALLTILPFTLLGGGGSWALFLCYWLAIAAGILYFRLGPKEVETEVDTAPAEPS